MNQYEKAKHEPDFSMVERIAAALDLPEYFFYAKDDDAAWLLVVLHRLPPEARPRLIQAVKDAVNQELSLDRGIYTVTRKQVVNFNNAQGWDGNSTTRRFDGIFGGMLLNSPAREPYFMRVPGDYSIPARHH